MLSLSNPIHTYILHMYISKYILLAKIYMHSTCVTNYMYVHTYLKYIKQTRLHLFSMYSYIVMYVCNISDMCAIYCNFLYVQVTIHVHMLVTSDVKIVVAALEQMISVMVLSIAWMARMKE